MSNVVNLPVPERERARFLDERMNAQFMRYARDVVAHWEDEPEAPRGWVHLPATDGETRRLRRLLSDAYVTWREEIGRQVWVPR